MLALKGMQLAIALLQMFLVESGRTGWSGKVIVVMELGQAPYSEISDEAGDLALRAHVKG